MNFHPHFPYFLSDVGDILHKSPNVILLSICGFRRNRQREGCTFPAGLHEIIFAGVKNALVKHALYVTEYTSCSKRQESLHEHSNCSPHQLHAPNSIIIFTTAAISG
jgi:hypothetical protein